MRWHLRGDDMGVRAGEVDDLGQFLGKIVVFDLDGTLAETAPDIIATLNIILAGQGLPPVPVARARDLVGAGARALIERGFRLYDRALPPALLEELFQDFLEVYAVRVAETSTLYPGVVEALTRLSGAGWLLAVCTNKPEFHSKLLIEALGITHHFAAICGRDTFPVCKPDPLHLTLTIEKAGGNRLQAIMVGDSLTDIATARAAGIPVIAVPFGYTDVPVEQLGPDVVIPHFDALHAAIDGLLARP
jgi:phosphoglycolate phosphatase